MTAQIKIFTQAEKEQTSSFQNRVNKWLSEHVYQEASTSFAIDEDGYMIILVTYTTRP